MLGVKPKEEKFFDLFIKTAQTSHKAALMLREFMGDLRSPENKYAQIKEIEHEGDKQLHEVLKQLNDSFITPIDREDIYMIAKEMDNVTDFIEQAASRFMMYNINTVPKDALGICDMIVDSTRELIAVMEEFRRMGKSTQLSKKIIEINRIEELGDVAFRKSVKELFTAETSAIDVIKWKDIYENLENVLDASEDVANIVEGVVMKHA